MTSRRRGVDPSILQLLVKIPLTLTGVLVALVLVSLVSGGFVIYANHVAVVLVSEPLLPLVVKVLVILTACIPVTYLLRKVPLGFLKGFVSTLFALFTLYALVRLLEYLVVVLVTMSIVVSILHYRTRYRGLVHPVKLSVLKLYLLLVPLLAVYVALSLYVPVISSQYIELVELDKPIEVNAFKRLVPLTTAYTHATSRLQVATHRIHPEEGSVYFTSGRSVYSWIIEPSGFWNEITKSPIGLVLVYGDTYPLQVEVILKETTWGLRNTRFRGLFFDSLYRQVVIHTGLQYEPLLESSVEIVYNEEILLLVPVVKWERGLLHSIPLLHGYVVVHEDGSMEFIPASDVSRDPRFRDLPLVPGVLARKWAELKRYHAGFIEFYFHHNTYVIRDVSGTPQPYLLVDSRDKAWWVLVAETPGDSPSAKYIMYIDPSNVKPVIYVYTLPTPVIGISRVESYVKQHYPLLDWDQLVVEEPALVIVNETMYWKVSVTTRDRGELVFIALVDAETGYVVSIDLSSWDVELAGELTAERALDMLVKRVVVEYERAFIEARIRYLEEHIKELKSILDQLESELEDLKRRLK